MSILQRIPWLALILELLAYSTLGWFISQIKAPIWIWFVVVVGILLFILSLTIPWLRIAEYFGILFKSQTSSLALVICAALLFFMIVAWFHVFLDTLLVVAATILVRIDFQAAGLKESLAFYLTSIFSITGLAAGFLIYKFSPLIHHLIN